MIEYVYRPVRIRRGVRTQARLFSGRFSLVRGQKPVTVALGTPDKRVAQALLRRIVVEKQSEAAGLIAPKTMREAAAALVDDLVTQYASDLKARASASHATESEARIRRVLVGTGWKRLADITPSSWVEFRAKLKRSAKTVKEYQTSVMAWLNWLVRMEKLAVNPLARVDVVKTKGKAVRKSRAFTQAEFSALLAAAPAHRRMVYLFLGYTGARKNEARSLLWSDVDLTARPCVRFREENTKSDAKRVVPLKAELAEALERWCVELEVDGGMLHEPVFPRFPSDDALHADLAKAGIERRDASGRVVHFHAFRKTFQTWGAVAGVGQRSAQEMLGHSDPSLTADAYTDTAALQLHTEVAKLPWLGESSAVAGDAQTAVKTATPSRFRALLGELISLAQVVVTEGDAADKPAPALAARHGFEP
jgi:integrase